MKKPIICLLVSLFMAASVSAQDIDAFKYEDDAGLQRAWTPMNEWSGKPMFQMGGDMIRAMRMQASFSRLNDWRVYWDHAVEIDLGSAEQIIIKLRAGDPTAVGSGSMYFQSGQGWYRMPGFGVSGSWKKMVLDKSKAVVEGSPAGWAAVTNMRLGFEPSGKNDTWIEVASITAQAGWPLEHIGKIGNFNNFEDAVASITAAAAGTDAQKDVADRLMQATRIYDTLKALPDVRGDTAQEKIFEGRALLAQAWSLIQKPRKEFRGVWIHHGDGTRAFAAERAERWKDALPTMAANGINAVIPNVLWSGTAYYPSKVVGTHPLVENEGDYLQEIIDAAKPLGMEVHAWKVMWQFAEGWLAPDGVSEPFRKEGRLQVDKDGMEKDWLCPCDERNIKMELAALKELAVNYDLTGIHLDYIRYGNPDVSYSKHCRAKFEKARGKVKNWPVDVAQGGSRYDEYHEFRVGTVTDMVRRIRKMMKEVKPNLELSAAVFPSVGSANMSVSQDWPAWSQEGLMDWIASMTYTEDADSFAAMVESQVKAMEGAKTILRPGLQTTYNQGKVLALESAVRQVQTVRDLDLDGFVWFEWREQLQDTILPYLRAGMFREGDYSLKFREIPENQKPREAVKGAPLGEGEDRVLIDDFEDGNLFTAQRGIWQVDQDGHNMGTVARPKPLELLDGGANGSTKAVRFFGHIGPSKAPWPYAVLAAGLARGGAATDLTPFGKIEFMAKGDGKNYEVVLIRQSVTDYGHFKASFKATHDWTKVTLSLKDFAQPDWGAPVQKGFSDVTQLRFQPGGQSDEDFDLSVDEIYFAK